MRIGALTDIGRYRKLNEDNFFIYRNERLVGGMVADGMGGHNAGEVASKMATELVKSTVIEGFSPNMDYMELSELIRRAIRYANEEIYRRSNVEQNTTGMGTTAAVAFVFSGKLITANVGDSRVYLVKDNQIKQITNDHSYVEELVRRGEISAENAKNHPQKNYITRALGTEKFVQSDILVTGYNGETVLICSDGLTNLVSDEQILDIILKNDDFEVAAQELVRLANQKGGADNITCVIFDV